MGLWQSQIRPVSLLAIPANNVIRAMNAIKSHSREYVIDTSVGGQVAQSIDTL